MLVSCELCIHVQLAGSQLKIIVNRYGFRSVHGCVLYGRIPFSLCIVRLMLGLIFVTVNWLVNFCAYLNFHNETLSDGFSESCNYMFAYMFSFMN